MGTICSSVDSRNGRVPSSHSDLRPSYAEPSIHRSVNNVTSHTENDGRSTPYSIRDNISRRHMSTPKPIEKESRESAKSRVPLQTIFDPEDVQLSALGKVPPHVAKRLVCRAIGDKEEVLSDKVIRVYHISDDTDSQEERELLQTKVYPKFRTICQENGYDLEVTDLHWGYPDNFMVFRENGKEPHKHLKDLLAQDAHTIVVVFLNEKYGSYGVPRQITEGHISAILERVDEEETKFLLQWYKKDDNRNPGLYVLEPIGRNIEQYGSTCPNEHEKACKDWLDSLEQLRKIIWHNSEKEFQTSCLISSLEAELSVNVLDDGFPPDNVILIRRYFSKFDSTSISSDILRRFTDLSQGKVDEIAQTKLNNLTNNINNKIKPTNKIELEVPWHEGSFDTTNTQQYSYIKELCSRFEKVLQVALEKVMAVKVVYDRIRVNMVGAGMEHNLYDEVVTNTDFCQMLTQNLLPRPDVFDLLKNYVINGHPMASSEHVRPVVMAGGNGSGKSSLVAELAIKYCTFRGWTKSACIIRHVGACGRHMTLDQLIASLSVQICFLYDLPYEYAHRPVSMYPLALGELLHRVAPITPLVIVIDDIDCLPGSYDMTWLPEELPGHIRIVLTVTTNTKVHGVLKNMTWQAERYLIEIPELSTEQAVQMLKAGLVQHQRQLTEPQMEIAEELVKANPIPLYINLIISQALHWSSSMPADNDYLGVDVRECIGKIIDVLGRRFGDEPLGRLLNYLTLLATGVTDTEMKDLLSIDEGFLLPVFFYAEPKVRRAPDYIWNDIKTYLSLQLMEHTQHGYKLTKWKHMIFYDIFKEKYQAYATTTWMKIHDYFDGRWSNGKKIPFASKDEGIEHLCDRFVKPQPLMFGKFYNHRKLANISGCLIQNYMASTLREDYLLSKENLTLMLRACGLYQVLLGCNIYLTIQPKDKEVLFLYDILRQLASLICQSSDNLWSQLYLLAEAGHLDTKELPTIDNIIDSLKTRGTSPGICPPFLIPSNLEIVHLYHRNRLKPKPVIQGLFPMVADSNHVVSVSLEEGEVVVWNVHHQVPVRTLKNLQEPKTVKMIDSSRAVILCSRELIIYNLDEGKEERRLKGVLNIKMPFYGVLDDEHTVVLSRNRMYVNVINNTTGDLDSTFKVGEDRFLDSLILSGNGEWCVCGDQVQKPFPLLVWDLVNRRLVHDLRISGHEFITRMSAITSEGHYVVCICKLTETESESLPAPLSHYSIIEQAVTVAKYRKEKAREPNFLIVYDLQSGSLFKKWKPDYDTTSVSISSASGLVISGHEDGSILVWDLVGGAQRHRLTGHSRGPDHISLAEDGERAATCDFSCKDPSVRLWDLMHGICLGTFSSEFGVTCCQIASDGSVVVIGLPGQKKIVCLWANKEDQENSKMDISIYGDASRNKEIFIMNHN